MSKSKLIEEIVLSIYIVGKLFFPAKKRMQIIEKSLTQYIAEKVILLEPYILVFVRIRKTRKFIFTLPNTWYAIEKVNKTRLKTLSLFYKGLGTLTKFSNPRVINKSNQNSLTQEAHITITQSIYRQIETLRKKWRLKR